ncbi:MAG: sigma-70 family RNA polymerase sigma factor [Pirellulales bacterium]|nr:sigma-70 family RNA polymerase sigma factor [Pirellulales bacterium]
MAITESTARRYELADPDVRLMLAVREGDAAAFEQLMQRYQNRVLTVLQHLVGSPQEAEDLAQEVFLRVFRARKNYAAGAKFSTWLFTIVNNVAFNARRGRSRRKEVQVRDEVSSSGSVRGMADLAQAASGMMPTRVIDKEEMRDVVRAALDVLNERQRMAVLLNKFEGLGYADIAEAMQMSPQAIKSLLSRARVALRDVIEPYLQSGVRSPLE